MTTEEFGNKLDQIFSYMKEILVEKNRSYGGASFQGEGLMPVLGNVFRQKDKMSRYENLVSKLVNEKIDYTSSEVNPFGESIWDTVCDIFGYACIGLCILDERGMGKLPDTSAEDIRKEELDYWIKVASEKTKEAVEGLKNPHEDQYGNPLPHGNDPIEVSPSITSKSDHASQVFIHDDEDVR